MQTTTLKRLLRGAVGVATFLSPLVIAARADAAEPALSAVSGPVTVAGGDPFGDYDYQQNCVFLRLDTTECTWWRDHCATSPLDDVCLHPGGDPADEPPVSGGGGWGGDDGGSGGDDGGSGGDDGDSGGDDGGGDGGW
jgi:uncharacterized membrane protein YgcG